MTRKRPRFSDKIQDALKGVDKMLVNRSDINDYTKIKDLEEKMNEESSVYNINDNFNVINLVKISKTSKNKIKLKNSKRF